MIIYNESLFIINVKIVSVSDLDLMQETPVTERDDTTLTFCASKDDLIDFFLKVSLKIDSLLTNS